MKPIGRNLMFAAGGVVVGYFVAKVHLQRVYEEIAVDQINEAKEFYKNLYEVSETALPEETVEVIEKMTSNDTDGAMAAVKSMINYQSFHKTKPEPEKEIVPPGPELEVSEMDGTAVRISLDEYQDDTGYDSIFVNYWAGDNTVVGVDGTIFSNEQVTKFIGDTNLESMMEEPYEGEDVIYIRNHHYGQDFEVHYNEESYSAVRQD